MVESSTLFEWSTEVAIALSMRFCSWVVAEDDNEDIESIAAGNSPSSYQEDYMKLRRGMNRLVPSSDGDSDV